MTTERCHVGRHLYRFAGREITPAQARREVDRLERSIPWRVRVWRIKRRFRALLLRAGLI